MKKWVAFLFVCIFANSFSQTNISPQFSELKGMEDQLGNTHLFYRIYTKYENPPVYQWSNHIFHLDLSVGIDTLFISSSGHEDPIYNFSKWVSDVDYWNHNPEEFIFSGGYSMGPYFEGSAFVERFDGYYNTIDYFWGSADYLDISPTNDSLLYLGVNAYGGFQTLSSSNGGRSWDTLNLDYQFLSLCPSNENIYFVENEDRELYRTTDAGNSFNLVDPEFLVDTRFYYDSDGQHIYRNSIGKLIVSNNLGESGSWEVKYNSENDIYVSVDYYITGKIFLGTGTEIFVSENFGENFYFFKAFESNICGLYKKPNSDKLFVATQFRIYEINLSDGSFEIIKSITPVSESYDWFPLNIGNYWVYMVDRIEGGIATFVGNETAAIVDTTSLANGLKYYVYEHHKLNGDSDTTYLRLDSLSGKLLAYSFESVSDLLFDDLFAEPGDTVCYEYNPTWNCQIVQLERGYGFYGNNYLIKEYYRENSGWYYKHTLMKGKGLQEIYIGNVIIYRNGLHGCIIDGILYGDTTTTSVEDENPPIASTFELEQNYPNPFNQSTVISYRLPVTSNVTLIVYDVLGNEIATLVNEEKPAGEYQIEFNTGSHSGEVRNLPSGIYFYQLHTGEFVQTKKMILLK